MYEAKPLSAAESVLANPPGEPGGISIDDEELARALQREELHLRPRPRRNSSRDLVNSPPLPDSAMDSSPPLSPSSGPGPSAELPRAAALAPAPSTLLSSEAGKPPVEAPAAVLSSAPAAGTAGSSAGVPGPPAGAPPPPPAAASALKRARPASPEAQHPPPSRAAPSPEAGQAEAQRKSVPAGSDSEQQVLRASPRLLQAGQAQPSREPSATPRKPEESGERRAGGEAEWGVGNKPGGEGLSSEDSSEQVQPGRERSSSTENKDKEKVPGVSSGGAKRRRMERGAGKEAMQDQQMSPDDQEERWAALARAAERFAGLDDEKPLREKAPRQREAERRAAAEQEADEAEEARLGPGTKRRGSSGSEAGPAEGEEGEEARAKAPRKPQHSGASVAAWRQVLSTRELQDMYKDLFGITTKVHNKDWILRKICDEVGPDGIPPLPPGRELERRADKQRAARADQHEGGLVRCSRNDGKNWRCGNLAVEGHKHCAKHMRCVEPASGAGAEKGRARAASDPPAGGSSGGSSEAKLQFHHKMRTGGGGGGGPAGQGQGQGQPSSSVSSLRSAARRDSSGRDGKGRKGAGGAGPKGGGERAGPSHGQSDGAAAQTGAGPASAFKFKGLKGRWLSDFQADCRDATEPPPGGQAAAPGGAAAASGPAAAEAPAPPPRTAAVFMGGMTPEQMAAVMAAAAMAAAAASAAASDTGQVSAGATDPAVSKAPGISSPPPPPAVEPLEAMQAAVYEAPQAAPVGPAPTFQALPPGTAAASAQLFPGAGGRSPLAAAPARGDLTPTSSPPPQHSPHPRAASAFQMVPKGGEGAAGRGSPQPASAPPTARAAGAPPAPVGLSPRALFPSGPAAAPSPLRPASPAPPPRFSAPEPGSMSALRVVVKSTLESLSSTRAGGSGSGSGGPPPPSPSLLRSASPSFPRAASPSLPPRSESPGLPRSGSPSLSWGGAAPPRVGHFPHPTPLRTGSPTPNQIIPLLTPTFHAGHATPFAPVVPPSSPESHKESHSPASAHRDPPRAAVEEGSPGKVRRVAEAAAAEAPAEAQEEEEEGGEPTAAPEGAAAAGPCQPEPKEPESGAPLLHTPPSTPKCPSSPVNGDAAPFPEPVTPPKAYAASSIPAA